MNNAEEKNTSHMIFYGEKDIDYTKSSNYAFLNWNLYNYSSNFPHFTGFSACPLVK